LPQPRKAASKSSGQGAADILRLKKGSTHQQGLTLEMEADLYLSSVTEDMGLLEYWQVSVKL
jgi:hypothetical protein